MKIESIDHIVLTVQSIEESCTFYSDLFGMERRTFGNGRTALHFGNQKFNLHQVDKPVDLNVKHATPGSADLCLVTKSPLSEVISHFQAKGVQIIEGEGLRTGALGKIKSIYIYDPDENLVEIATYNF